ncbi:response regulator [Bradyrhizobium sp. PMVTL-01]|uniref:response regulator n=1 Tax=Bradyrhizobium sp. PMVTL-01 TaxID=3434999 RepID=UPI003F708B53
MPVILVVEDEPPVQEFVKDALHEGGYDLTVSSSASEALTLLRGCVVKYRALVTDIHIDGEMNGWELARQARQIDPVIPVIYITGAAAADQWASQGVPESMMLQKPFAPAQLVTAVSQLLNATAPNASQPLAESKD